MFVIIFTLKHITNDKDTRILHLSVGGPPIIKVQTISKYLTNLQTDAHVEESEAPLLLSTKGKMLLGPQRVADLTETNNRILFAYL